MSERRVRTCLGTSTPSPRCTALAPLRRTPIVGAYTQIARQVVLASSPRLLNSPTVRIPPITNLEMKAATLFESWPYLRRN